MDACPTGAIPAPYVVDGSRCISYFTIELKEQIPADVQGKFENWIFGCDICQDVCPWNRFSRPHREPQFQPNPALADMKPADWQEITEEVFRAIFRESPVQRTKLAGLKRNIAFVALSELGKEDNGYNRGQQQGDEQERAAQGNSDYGSLLTSE
jgi:epoxyqueuosine reductase